MSPSLGKTAVIVVLLLAIAGVLYFKGSHKQDAPRQVPTVPPTIVSTPDARVATPAPTVVAPSVPTAKPTPAPTRKAAPAVTPPVKPTAASPKPMAAPPKPPVKPTPPAANATVTTPVASARLPRLLELGADKCVPCKMMQPVLAELRQAYAGKLQVDFIDVWKDPAVGDKYGVQAIPTQIFFDADGNEVFRHLGFFAKEDIVAKFAELGISL